jgi:hypothetical protein
MAKAKKTDLLSYIKCLISKYVGEVEAEIVRKTLMSLLTLFFMFSGIIFLALALKDFLVIFTPDYIANTILGIIFLMIALILKKG